MPTFHRLITPTYFFTGGGTVPTGYDYLNDPTDPSVGGAGVPAPMETSKKVGGVNDGTYFVAFHEDGTSAHTNRANYALGENTDIIDDILNESLARIVLTAAALAEGPVTSVVVTDSVFVGKTGMANNQSNRDRLIRFVDANDNEIEVGGSQVVPTLIHDGASVSVVGTNYHTNPTIDLLPAIPAGISFRVVYGRRSSYTDVSKNNQDAVYSPHLSLAGMVGWEAKKMLRTLHAPDASNQLWSDNWDSTIRALASSGLNERYRRATLPYVDFVTGDYNQAGDGNWVERDGRAIEVITPDFDMTTEDLHFPDPVMASYRVTSELTPGTGTWPNTAHGGNVGLFQEVAVRNSTDTDERVRSEVTGPLLLELVPRDIRASTLGAANVWTRISSTAVGLANPTSGGTETSRATVQCGGSDFFYDGSTNTVIREGYDFLEVTDDATNEVLGTYRIDTFTSNVRARLRTISGAYPDFGAVARNVRLRLLQTSVAVGGSSRVAAGGSALGFFGLTVLQNSQITDDITSERAPVPGAVFFATYSGRLDTGDYPAAKRAVGWGGFLEGSAPRQAQLKGFLQGDGGIESTGGRVHGRFFCFRQSAVHNTYTTASPSLTIDPMVNSSVIARLDGSSNAVALTIVLDGDYIPIYGDVIRVKFEITDTTDNAVSVNWPADFLFSDGDDIIPQVNATVRSIYVTYEFEYSFTHDDGDVWFARRYDY